MSTSPMVPGRHVGGTERAPARTDGERAYHSAKTSLWLFAASFLASFALFIVIWRTFGYTVLFSTTSAHGGVAPSAWAGRGIWLLLTVVYACPEIVVVRYARKAARAGHPHWRIPVIWGAVLAGVMPVLGVWLLVG